jgi:hypothetical protein
MKIFGNTLINEERGKRNEKRGMRREKREERKVAVWEFWDWGGSYE